MSTLLDTNLLTRLANPAQPMHQVSLDSVAALLQQHRVIGKNGHDARLVAAMIVHGIDRLLTFNKADFARYQQITVNSPQEVVGPPPTP